MEWEMISVAVFGALFGVNATMLPIVMAEAKSRPDDRSLVVQYTLHALAAMASIAAVTILVMSQ